MRASPVSYAKLTIERLGARGEGVARHQGRLVFTPYALAGECVSAEIVGDEARLIEVLEPSKDRVAPFCKYYGVCGGCAVQTLAEPAYKEWKRSLVETALRNAGIVARVAEVIDAHGAGRRRATFHARETRTGFMQARAHAIVEIDACPLFAPELEPALPAARALAKALAANDKPLDIAATATLDGLDVDLRGAGPLEEDATRALIKVAEQCDLARLSNHGRIVVQRRKPRLAVGDAMVTPPPGCFLQATAQGEAEIARLVGAAVGKAARVADLFCGVGAFALRLAAKARVDAYDNDAAAIAALTEAARAISGLRLAEARPRDLFKTPLQGAELENLDAVVFDPPRAGAQAQAEALAKAGPEKIVAVSCSAQSFARDAKTLIEGGYALSEVAPIDQFKFSPHVELVASFSRKAKPRKRGLLSR